MANKNCCCCCINFSLTVNEFFNINIEKTNTIHLS